MTNQSMQQQKKDQTLTTMNHYEYENRGLVFFHFFTSQIKDIQLSFFNSIIRKGISKSDAITVIPKKNCIKKIKK